MTGDDWPTRIEREIVSIKIGISAYARRPLDETSLAAAAHLVLCLQRTATGREGLSILKDWQSLHFNGNSSRQMIERSAAWLSGTAEKRSAALDDLQELIGRVEMELSGRIDPDDLAGEIDELRMETTCNREQRSAPPSDNTPALPQVDSVKQLRRALKSYASVYPYRSEPLTTAEEIAAAMPAKAVRQ